MDRYYWYWLSNIAGIGPVKMRRLLEVFGSPSQIYTADETKLRKVEKLSERDVAQIMLSRKDDTLYKKYFDMQKQGIYMTATGDANYPKRLENIYDAPVCLYYKGKLPDNKKPAVAIVGSRSCSEYGRQIAHTLGKELAMAGVEIISGLAMGIDASGHSGAIYGGGSTYAVMGCGVDICYPAANRKLYQEILLNGGILSEYPWQTPPSPGQFPVRNRIISGLSDIVIVVEARKKSGSLITADQALEQNREVMAVPGRIFDKTSEGCNRLIKMGAAIISTPQDVLEMLELTCPETVSSGNAKKFCLAPDEEMVYSNLDFTPKGLEEILMQCEKEPSELMEVLMRLIIKGMVRETSRNYYVKV